MHPRSNETPQAESFGEQGFSEALRAVVATVIVCCAAVGVGTLFTHVHHVLPAVVYVVLITCALAQAWQLVRGPIRALLIEISEPFDIWDD